ncbi:hypothetical protein ALC57_02686, partial [Trachymyrmex cornetzi]
ADMDNTKDREKIAKEIAKTNHSIRKKYRALKTGKMERDIALERHFKPIIDPLKQIVENTVESSKDPSMNETFFSGEEEEPKENDRVLCMFTILQFLLILLPKYKLANVIPLPVTRNKNVFVYLKITNLLIAINIFIQCKDHGKIKRTIKNTDKIAIQKRCKVFTPDATLQSAKTLHETVIESFLLEYNISIIENKSNFKINSNIDEQ